MSQTETTKAAVAEERTEEARTFVRKVKATTRRKHTSEEKIRIVLEGFYREVTVNELCRRGHQASFVLCLDQGVHGGREGEAGTGHVERRYIAGGTLNQERERRTEAVSGGVVPGGVPS